MSDRYIYDLDTYAMIDTNFARGFNDRAEEERYQAFKERLMRELAATRPASVNVYVDGVMVDYLPLIERK